jgi:hypothetical protein
VAALVDGFETPFGLELLSTVHWVMTRETPDSPEGVTRAVHAWGDQNRQFTPRQIELAAQVLSHKGWLHCVAVHQAAT